MLLRGLCRVARQDAFNRPAPVSPYRLRSAVAPLVFDCTKAREQFGWLPRSPYTRGAAQTAGDQVANAESRGRPVENLKRREVRKRKRLHERFR